MAEPPRCADFESSSALCSALTPRASPAFFYAPALASTSAFLESLFPPSLLATVAPDLNMEDNLAVEEAHEHLLAHPPEAVQRKLDERAGWLKLVREVRFVHAASSGGPRLHKVDRITWHAQDGTVLQQWDESRKKAEREEARERMRGRAGVV